MAYPLSATRLLQFARCPQAYSFRYEFGIKSPSGFGPAALSTALHRTLARVYGEFHFQAPMPLGWMEDCWQRSCDQLTPGQVNEGWGTLQRYWEHFLAGKETLRKPVGVEGRLVGTISAHGVEFRVTGRYDRLDWFEEGLELIDYKLSQPDSEPEANFISLQMGLYDLVLQQRYGNCLKRLSLIYLRSLEQVQLEVTEAFQQQAREAIAISHYIEGQG